MARVIREGRVVGLANHTLLLARNGARRHISDSAAPIRNARGELQGVVLVFRDVSEEYQLREDLANSELHFRALANSGQALVWTSGLDGGCDYFNEPWLRFTGRTQEQELGEGWAEGVHPDDRSRCLETYRAAFNRREPFSMEYRLRHVSGEYRWIMDQGSPRFDTEGHFLGYVGHCMDVTEAKRAEAEIERLAYHDALTGLPNRVLFLDRLAQALAASRRNRRCGAVLFVDLDQFKRINDVHGHALGDAVLRDVARRLEFYLRQVDTVARLGGDEFVILLPDLAANLDDAGSLVMAVAEKIRSALESPVTIDGQEFVTGASIGITVFPKDAESVDDLMREADTAMYRAKERGRNALAYFEPAMQEAVSERYALDRELREAVRDRSFELHLQSQVNASGRVIGAEALVRWRHPQRGLVMPTTFIPLAEESGLIVPLGEWVLRETCMLIARLDAEGRGLRIAVNVSPRQFHQTDFVQRIKEILCRHRRRPGLPHAGNHREPAGRTRLRIGGAHDRTGGARPALLHRRFRHRLFVPGLPETPAVVGAQDRQELRAGHSARPQRRRAGGDHPLDGAPSAFRGGGRRGGKRSPACLPAPAGVRALPGLLLPSPARDARLDRAASACGLIAECKKTRKPCSPRVFLESS